MPQSHVSPGRPPSSLTRRDFLACAAGALLAPRTARPAPGARPPLRRYTMAFILLYDHETDLATRRYRLGQVELTAPTPLDRSFEAMKQGFARHFRHATLGRAEMDTSYPTVALRMTPDLRTADGTVNTFRVCRRFYRDHPDRFDFLSIYTTFEENQPMNHTQVRNTVAGIGRPLFDHAHYYHSERLLGINRMRHVARHHEITGQFPGLARDSSALLHETGHQWGVYVGDDFTGQSARDALPIRQQGIHLYKGVQSPYPTATAMNADHWRPNPDGHTFARAHCPTVPKRYHPIQLYLMGLLDEAQFDLKITIYNAGVVPHRFNPTAATFFAERTIADIRKKHGPRLET